MKIVDRATFLALPAGTLFSKYTPTSIEGPSIKEGTIGADYVVQHLDPWFEGADDDGDLLDIMVAMEAGKESPPVDYDFAGRDGLFDADQRFVVWNVEDTRRLIARLQQALEQLLGAEPEEITS